MIRWTKNCCSRTKHMAVVTPSLFIISPFFSLLTLSIELFSRQRTGQRSCVAFFVALIWRPYRGLLLLQISSSLSPGIYVSFRIRQGQTRETCAISQTPETRRCCIAYYPCRVWLLYTGSIRSSAVVLVVQNDAHVKVENGSDRPVLVLHQPTMICNSVDLFFPLPWLPHPYRDQDSIGLCARCRQSWHVFTGPISSHVTVTEPMADSCLRLVARLLVKPQLDLMFIS